MSPSGQPYYYNHVTRESAWVLPQPAAAPLQPRPPPSNGTNSSGPASAVNPGVAWQNSSRPDVRPHVPSAAAAAPVWPPATPAAHRATPMRPQATQEPNHASTAPIQPHAVLVQRPQRPPPLAAPPLARPPPPLQNPHRPGPQMPQTGGPRGAAPAHQMHAAMWRPWMGLAMRPGGPSLQEQEAAAAEAAKRKFRQMLVEHEVNEFSRWEKASKKFDTDPRCVPPRGCPTPLLHAPGWLCQERAVFGAVGVRTIYQGPVS